NPAGGWRRFRVPVDPTGTLDPDTTYLAITADTIAVTTNVWKADLYPVGTVIFTMPKAAAFAGPNLPISSTQADFSDSDLVPVSSTDTTLRFATSLNNYLMLQEMNPDGTLSSPRLYQAPVTFQP